MSYMYESWTNSNTTYTIQKKHTQSTYQIHHQIYQNHDPKHKIRHHTRVIPADIVVDGLLVEVKVLVHPPNGLEHTRVI